MSASEAAALWPYVEQVADAKGLTLVSPAVNFCGGSCQETDPFKYLVAPRLIAGIITLPILVLVADIIGVLGGYLVGVYKLDFNDATYLRNTLEFLQFMDVFSGLVKAAVFGFLITLMGCYHGYTSKGGAQGVGLATTNAVVSSSILILTANYFITEAFFAR